MTQKISTEFTIDEFKTVIQDAVKMEIEKLKLNKPETPTEYITRKDAKEILGISLPTLNDWSKRGIIPSYRIASRVRYKREEVLNSVTKVHSLKYGRA